MINKERKYFKIRRTKAPKYSEVLSGVVRVYALRSYYTVNITFSPSLVTFLEEHMPQGVSPAKPAYLSVQQLGKELEQSGLREMGR